MSFDTNLRNLAKSNYWQTIYRTSKECSGVHIFENNSNFTGLQVIFLHWLKIYDLLYTELSQKEWNNLSQRVIEDNYRCDAFIYWRGKEIEKKILANKKLEKNSKHKPGVKSYDIYKGPKNKEEEK